MYGMTANHALTFLAVAVVIITIIGFFTWWIDYRYYNDRPVRNVKYKHRGSANVAILCFASSMTTLVVFLIWGLC